MREVDRQFNLNKLISNSKEIKDFPTQKFQKNAKKCFLLCKTLCKNFSAQRRTAICQMHHPTFWIGSWRIKQEKKSVSRGEYLTRVGDGDDNDKNIFCFSTLPIFLFNSTSEPFAFVACSGWGRRGSLLAACGLHSSWFHLMMWRLMKSSPPSDPSSNRI